MDNRLKQKLTNGEGVFGLIAPNSDPILAETVGLLGFDYFMIDGEHGPITVNEVENFCRACEIRNISPLARIRSNDPKLILQYLLSLIHISEPTRPERISYAVFCLKKKNN